MPKKLACPCASCKRKRQLRRQRAGGMELDALRSRGNRLRQYRTNNSNLSGGAKKVLHKMVDKMSGGAAKGLLADLLKGIDARLQVK